MYRLSQANFVLGGDTVGTNDILGTNDIFGTKYHLFMSLQDNINSFGFISIYPWLDLPSAPVLVSIKGMT